MDSRVDAEVLIGGKVYTLSGYESEEYFQRVASYINNKMSEYGKLDSFKKLPMDMQSVLMQINIADEYFKAKKQISILEEEVKAKRRDEIMELQQEIAFEKSQAMVGRKLDVMIEGEIVEEHAYVGRTYMDAPGVDGLIFINTEKELMSGDFVRVSVTGAVEYDLTGEICDEFTE